MVKLTDAERRGLEAVRAGECSRTYTRDGNTLSCRGGIVSPGTLWRLDRAGLIADEKASIRFQRHYKQILTPAGEKVAPPPPPAGPFYVYRRNKRSGAGSWGFVSEHADISDAEKAARKLCPRNAEIHTEPGHGLPHGFFGTHSGRGWSAMIETRRLPEPPAQ